MLLDVRDFQKGAHLAEIVLGHRNGYRHLILAVYVSLHCLIVLERLFILVELSKFFVCGDNVAVWVSIFPQFVKVHIPI